MLYVFVSVLCVVCTSVSALNDLKIGDECVTPNGEKAKCVKITDCYVIRQAIQYLEEDKIAFARQSQCGYDDTALVCCGKEGKMLDPQATTPARPVLHEKPADPSYKAHVIQNPLLPSASVCGRQSKLNKYTGKNVTETHEYPWMVTLNYKKNDGTPGGSLCSGTLINHRYVLTSATCLEIPGHELTNIHLGEWNFTCNGEGCDYYIDEENKTTVKRRQDYNIAEKISHPYFDKESGNDGIALLRIQGTIEYNDYIRPICLPPRNFPPPVDNGIMETTGWVASKEGYLTGTKLKANFTMASVEECNKTYPNFSYYYSHQICTKAPEGASLDDSGRPLLRYYEVNPPDDPPQWFQEGILTKVPGLAEKKGSTNLLYLRISRYYTWILNNLKKS